MKRQVAQMMLDDSDIKLKPINVLQLVIPIDFFKEHVEFSWEEWCWGLESQYVTNQMLVDEATVRILQDEQLDDTFYLLAAVFKDELDQVPSIIQEMREKDVIKRDLWHDEKNVLACKNKYLYVALLWLFDHLGEDYVSKDMGRIEAIRYDLMLYELIWDFRTPSDIAEYMREMVITYEVTEKNKHHFIKIWADYLREYEQFIQEMPR